MKTAELIGRTRVASGLRYIDQSVRMLKNLSSPASKAPRPRPTRRTQKAELRRWSMSERVLLDVLQKRFPDSSKTTLRQMLQANRVRVNGTTERNAKRPIEAEDQVEIVSKGEISDPRVTILYEDDDLIVIDKAAGLLTVASPTETEETVVAILNHRVHVVHRLDRDSSGVLVFAKDFDMRERLQALFAAHD